MRNRPALVSIAFAVALALSMPDAAPDPVATGEDRDPAPAETPGPLHVAGSERVEVQLVLVDVLVLDRADRTVAGLGPEDFRLVLDERRVEVASVDVRCDSRPDPGNGERLELRDRTGEPDLQPRNFVLVFDYFHMNNPVDTLASAREVLDRLQVGGERHMVATIGEALRIELPFTDDPQRVRATLDRMERDPTLYAGNSGRLTERRFYERLLALFDLMELEPGRKIMVLFSGPFLADGWNHDVYYRRLAAMASRTRTAVYPVDSRGLSGPVPDKLARIATATGGRITARTNDLALAYARAQRDLDCTYTLGFYDRDPRPRKDRRIKVYSERPGTKVVFPSGYILRSREQQLDSMSHTAGMAPGMFEDGGIRAEAFVTGPASSRRWYVRLVAEVPRATQELGGALESRWKLGGIVRKERGTRVHRFRRTVEHAPEVIDEVVRLPPGRYAANLWLFNERMDRPLALELPFQVPEMPAEKLFLVGPFLFQPAGPSRGSSPGGPAEDGGERLVVGGQVTARRPFGVSMEICRRRVEAAASVEVNRRILDGSGNPVRELPVLDLTLEPGESPRCTTVRDDEPEGLLPGSYRMEVVVLEGEATAGRAELPFEASAPDSKKPYGSSAR